MERSAGWPGIHRGQHTAYGVPRERVEALAQQLERAGHKVERWREDHPSERQISPYVMDPSGNWVQLVPSDSTGSLIDHVGIEVHHHDYA
ncbi:MAG: hypothetical protein HW416_3472, partial [Chloroflexi bacterium]|nr:hypothetical protein [Chloroflexota bacterium]